MATHSAVVPKDERDDFWAVCVSTGHGNSNFMLSAVEDTPAEPGPIARLVTVTRTVGGKAIAKNYDGGNGTNWPADAEIDLRAGYYGTP